MIEPRRECFHQDLTSKRSEHGQMTNHNPGYGNDYGYIQWLISSQCFWLCLLWNFCRRKLARDVTSRSKGWDMEVNAPTMQSRRKINKWPPTIWKQMHPTQKNLKSIPLWEQIAAVVRRKMSDCRVTPSTLRRKYVLYCRGNLGGGPYHRKPLFFQ